MKTGKTLQELAAEIERQHTTKKDYVLPTPNLVMRDEGGDMRLNLGRSDLDFGVGEIAHGQIADHTGIPQRYYDRMKKEAPELLANNVNAWFEKYPAPRMVRTLDGGARAFLSDKFQRLDNYDFASAIMPILAERQLKVISCEITDKRLYVKAVDEKLFRDVPVGFKMGDGSHKIFDTCAPVVIASNSEVGFGRLILETGIFTSACTNLAMWAGAGGMRRTHVGARTKLAEGMDVVDLDEIMSQGTRKKTLEALWMQTRDVVVAAFDEKVLTKRITKLAEAAENKITGKLDKVMELAAEKFDLGDGERESIFKHLIEGGNLTQYGLHAAVTRAAQDVASYDRATDLEYVGGKIIELPATDWNRIAEAA